MQQLKDALSQVFVGEPVLGDGLRIYPIFPGQRPPSPLSYRIIDTALEARDVEVRELEPASVPTLVVDNKGVERVLAIEGQTLVGGKQDRMLTTSVLVDGHSVTQVPVCCVERRRWQSTSHDFKSGDSGHASLRRKSHHAVSSHVAQHGSHGTDQQGVWSHIEEGHSSHGSSSHTRAVKDLHAQRDTELQKQVDALPYPSGAIGAVAVLADGSLAADIFDQAATASTFWARLIRSYAFDQTPKRPSGMRPEDMLKMAANAPMSVHPSPGGGVDVRVTGRGVAGSALCLDDVPVHVRLFVEPAQVVLPHTVDTNPLVLTLPGFLSASECQDYIREGEAKGFCIAPITTSAGPIVESNVRNNGRVMFDDPELAAHLWLRLKPHVPARIDGWDAVGLNERFRFYRYQPGQRFAPHWDGNYIRNPKECSMLTFMLYLNGGFEGGLTRFYDNYHNRRFSIRPLEGAGLIFIHEQLHEGTIVTQGVKYVLRTDVMYREP